MTVISFTIDAVPVPKGRPRMNRLSGQVYTPLKTRAYENAVALKAKLAMQGKQPFHGAVKVSISFYLPIPKSWTKKRRQEAIEGRHAECIVSDLDNYVKACADGMNGIVYHDDRQIVSLHARKRYSSAPETTVLVEGLS